MKKGIFYSLGLALAISTAYANIESFSGEGQGVYAETISSDNHIPYRTFVGRDPHGFSVDLDDGSEWRMTDSTSRMVAKSWWINDPVVIHPTFFPGIHGSRYYLLNLRTKQTAAAELIRGPYLGLETNLRIWYIEWDSLYVELKEGELNEYNRVAYFRIDPADYDKFRRWEPKQSIILGHNRNTYSGWFSYYDYILINVERDEYVRANFGG